MNATLYTNNSEPNKLGKSLTTLVTISSMNLKESVSIIDPTFLLTGISTSLIAKVNYMYVPELSRYYFVQDITSVRQGLWSLKCHVDVIETYKAGILEQTAILSRQQKQWNLYLDDGLFKVYQDPNIVTKAFPSGFTNQNFVLAVAGG